MDDKDISPSASSLSEDDSPSFQDVSEKLSDPPVAEPQLIEASFFSNRGGKFLDLIKQNAEPTAFSPKGVVYALTRACLVSDVVIQAGEKINRRKLNVEYLPAGNQSDWKTAVSSSTDSSEICLWTIGAFVTKIRISSTAGRLQFRQKVIRVKISGYTEDEIRGTEESIRFHEKLRADVKRLTADGLATVKASQEALKKEQDTFSSQVTKTKNALKNQEEQAKLELESIRTETDQAKTSCSEANGQLKVAQDQLTTKTKELESSNNELSKLKDLITQKQQTITQLESQVEQKESDRNGLAKKITDLQAQVQDWTSRKLLFTANLEGVLKEYTLQVVFYSLLCLIPIGIVGFIGYHLFAGARAMLDSVLSSTPPASMWAYLVTRMPFAAVGTAIVVTLIKYAFLPLVRSISDIFKTRQKILAASYLIKEVTEKVAADVGMSTEETANLLIAQRLGRLERILVEAHGGPAKDFDIPLVNAGAKIVDQIASNTLETDSNS